MPELLRIEGISAGYGDTVVLEDVSLTITSDDTLTILGRNGVGKTTLLATIMGQTVVRSGQIWLRDIDLCRRPRFERAHLGIGYVPQEREIFPSLTVEENLLVAARIPPGGELRWTREKVYELFPRLAERRKHRGNHLSGGEQQMLAVARALMGNPVALLLDEPLEGLAPTIVSGLLSALQRLREDDGLAVVLVEQNARVALDFAAKATVLSRGHIVYSGASRELQDDSERLASLLAVSATEVKSMYGSGRSMSQRS